MNGGMGFSEFTLVLDTAVAGIPGISRPLIVPAGSSGFTLADQLVSRAQLQSGNDAIATGSQSWTYGELLCAAVDIAVSIQTSPPFQPGARIVLLLPNSFEYVAAFYGTLLAGAVVVPVPPRIEDQSFERICESTEAIAVIVPSSARRLPTALKDSTKQPVSLNGCDTTAAERLSSPGVIERDLATIFFTSGSTGDPKGVMLSHRNLLQNAASIQQYLDIRSTDRPLCVLPFFHAFGNSVLQSHLLAGATLVLDGNTLFPDTIVTAMARHHATSLSGVPDLFRLLLERSSLGQSKLPSLRYMAVAGGALQHDLALAVADRIAPAKFFVMYGQTEATARLAFVPPEQLSERPAGCIGHAIPGVDLEVVDEQGCHLNSGETGELRAAGPNVMLGYWQDPQATAERIRDGWLYTGDLATTDDQGWIYHRGRRNAIVKIAGFRVHPGDLEEFAIRRLLVDQAVAVPYEQTQIGTRLALFFRRSGTSELTVSEMLQRCRAELPRHLVPSLIRQLDEFPLNHALKIDRIRLSQMAEQETSGAHPNVDHDQNIVKGGCP